MNVLYEDNHVIAVVKPYNIPVQADESGDPDLLSMVKAYLKQKYNKPGAVFLGLVHRLDRPTGGVMLFARTSKAASRLSLEIREGRMKKEYFAVLQSAPPKKEGILTGYLKKDPRTHSSYLVSPNEPQAKYAELAYRVVGQKSGLTLVKVDLKTGRHHQIRVQFASIGCPLYGDMRYGNSAQKRQLALWCSRLIVKHPTKAENLDISAIPTNHPFCLFETAEVPESNPGKAEDPV